MKYKIRKFCLSIHRQWISLIFVFLSLCFAVFYCYIVYRILFISPSTMTSSNATNFSAAAIISLIAIFFFYIVFKYLKYILVERPMLFRNAWERAEAYGETQQIVEDFTNGKHMFSDRIILGKRYLIGQDIMILPVKDIVSFQLCKREVIINYDEQDKRIYYHIMGTTAANQTIKICAIDKEGKGWNSFVDFCRVNYPDIDIIEDIYIDITPKAILNR